MSIKKLINSPGARVAIFVFLTTLLAFGLGYLLGSEINRAPIVIEQVSPPAAP